LDHVLLWEHRQLVPVDDGEPHNQDTFDEYLRWFHRSTRTHIKALYTDEGVEEDSGEDVIEDVYDEDTRIEP
jgi:hypothetical protein